MKITEVEPNLTEDERKRKLQEASQLFVNIYEQHQQKKLTKQKKQAD